MQLLTICVIRSLIFATIATVTLATDVAHDKMKGMSTQGGQSCRMHSLGKLNVLNCSGVYVFEKKSLVEVGTETDLFGEVEVDIDVLDLSYTSLTSLSIINKDMLSKLSVLNVSHNKIAHIEEETLEKVKLLEKIDLSYNQIDQISDSTFMSLSYLNFLDLSHNKLKYLPHKLPMLEWLDLSANEIEFLPEIYSTVLYPQTVFLIGQNPFRCTCELIWLKDLLDTRQYILKFMKQIDQLKFIPVCNFPVTIAGKLWTDLKEEDFKCSEELNKYFIEVNGDLSMDGEEFKVTLSDIRYNSVGVKWNQISSDSDKMLDVKFHKFGESKSKKQVVLPLSAASYRLKNLQSDTPYVICFDILSGAASESLGCEEITTAKAPSEDLLAYWWLYFLHTVKNYSNHLIVILILLITATWVLNITGRNEKDE